MSAIVHFVVWDLENTIVYVHIHTEDRVAVAAVDHIHPPVYVEFPEDLS